LKGATLSEKRAKKKSPSPVQVSGAGSPMDVTLLEKLVKLMAANDLNTIELREGTRRVTLKRGAASMSYTAAPVVAHPAPVPAAAQAPVSEDVGLLQLTSPMPGTFYVAPKQGEKPFVKIGSEVDEQTDVCIIEAMKVFNNLPAGVRGTIARVCIEDGQPVEFGTVLFLVKPAGSL
jgi:acetyl-CoA carboxylase biotin carboxyl carrier protein